MTDDRFTETLWGRAAGWDELFEGPDKGGDISSRQHWAVLFGSAMASGPVQADDMWVVGAASPPEDVLFAVPCFFDDNPLSGSQVGQDKVKFNGKARRGVLAVTDRSVSFGHEIAGRFMFNLAIGCFPRQNVVALNDVLFKFSRLSITAVSLGPGYELLYRAVDGTPGRLLFRMALTPLSGEVVVAQLRTLVGPPPGPLGS